jgi:hypothetical protein
MGRFRGGGGPLFQLYTAVSPDARVFRHAVNLIGVLGARSALAAKILVSSLFMHFSFYLMIAALVLVGFEVAYALYQLTLFVL